MRRDDVEVLIVGGGVAGLALAARLGSDGRAVRVVDKAPLPRDKVCGEGLMPLGLEALRDLGFDPLALPGAPFRGLRYRSRRYGARLPFPAGVSGRGIRRTALLASLAARCAALPTVALCEDHVRGVEWRGDRVRGVRGVRDAYRAPLIVAADGVHSTVARQAGADLRTYGERMALRRHYRRPGEAPLDDVWVGVFAPYDVYLTPVGDDTVLATTMTDRAGFRTACADYEALLAATPFAACFRAAEPASALLRWHHPLFVPRGYVPGGVLLVGDAGGGVDPCLGLGISMALQSAVFAAAAVPGLLGPPRQRNAALQQFDGQRKKLFRHFSAFGNIFRLAVRSPTGSDLLVWGMRHWPAVATSLLEIVGTGRTWRTFPWRALLEPIGRRRSGIASGDREP